MKKGLLYGLLGGLIIGGFGLFYYIGSTIPKEEKYRKLEDAMTDILNEDLKVGALSISDVKEEKYTDTEVICDGKEYFVFTAKFPTHNVAILGFHKDGVYYIDGIGEYKEVFKDYCEDGLMDWGGV